MHVEMKPKQRRRGNGEGTIISRNGKFCGVISVGDANGKRKRKWVTAATRREAVEKMKRLWEQQRAGTLVFTTKITVAEWIEHWLTSIGPFDKKKPLRPTTVAHYRKVVKLYVKGEKTGFNVGGIALSKLTTDHVERMHGAMREHGAAAGTIRVAHGILCRALAVAVGKRKIAFNVCQLAGRPGAVQKEMQSLTVEQARNFLREAGSDRLFAMYIVGLTTGMRQGELFGLKRDDIDLAAGAVFVRRTLCYLDGDFVENPPKSKMGSRVVRLPAMAVEALHDHFRRMEAEGNAESRYVFCCHLGGPLWRSNVRRNSFRPILKAAGLPMVRFHDLRHTMASLLLSNGENVKVVSQMLGHGDVKITLATYAHVLPGMDESAARRIGGMLSQPKRISSNHLSTATAESSNH